MNLLPVLTYQSLSDSGIASIVTANYTKGRAIEGVTNLNAKTDQTVDI